MANTANTAYTSIPGTSADYNISDDKKTVRVRFPSGRMTADEFKHARKMAIFYVMKASNKTKDADIIGNCKKTSKNGLTVLTVTIDPAGKLTLDDVRNFTKSLEKACVDPNLTQGGGTPNPTQGGGTPNQGGGTPNQGGGTPNPTQGGGTPTQGGGTPNPTQGGGTPTSGSGSAPKDPKEITQDVWGRLFSTMEANKVPGSDKAKQAFWDAYNAAKGSKS